MNFWAKEVTLMSVKERILTIRLFDKVMRQPAYAAALGIECIQDPSFPEDREEPP